MNDWNLLVTAAPGPGHWHRLLGALAHVGRFHRTSFRGVCIGTVEDPLVFLETLRAAREAREPWAEGVARAIPIERCFRFLPDTFAADLEQAVTPFAARLEGSFHVRLERRGLAGRVRSPVLERAVADHLLDLAAARGVTLRTDFADPDYVVAAETIGDECGIALIPRDMRRRYPFVAPR